MEAELQSFASFLNKDAIKRTKKSALIVLFCTKMRAVWEYICIFAMSKMNILTIRVESRGGPYQPSE